MSLTHNQLWYAMAHFDEAAAVACDMLTEAFGDPVNGHVRLGHKRFVFGASWLERDALVWGANYVALYCLDHEPRRPPQFEFECLALRCYTDGTQMNLAQVQMIIEDLKLMGTRRSAPDIRREGEDYDYDFVRDYSGSSSSPEVARATARERDEVG